MIMAVSLLFPTETPYVRVVEQMVDAGAASG